MQMLLQSSFCYADKYTNGEGDWISVGGIEQCWEDGVYTRKIAEDGWCNRKSKVVVVQVRRRVRARIRVRDADEIEMLVIPVISYRGRLRNGWKVC